MRRRLAVKSAVMHLVPRMLSIFRRLGFFVYIFIWGLTCFGFRLFRLLAGKIIFAMTAIFAAHTLTRQQSKEDPSSNSNDQIVVISKLNGE